MNRELDSIKRKLFDSDATHPAAKAIQQSLNKLVGLGVMTTYEFMDLIDLDNKENWIDIARDFAERIAAESVSGRVEAKEVKPWIICKDYKTLFKEIEDDRAWRSANGAISSIISQVRAIFKEQ